MDLLTAVGLCLLRLAIGTVSGSAQTENVTTRGAQHDRAALHPSGTRLITYDPSQQRVAISGHCL
jgi:hypothetical protein